LSFDKVILSTGLQICECPCEMRKRWIQLLIYTHFGGEFYREKRYV
jgi:hypothetical protein